jgi:hypothetical protein
MTKGAGMPVKVVFIGDLGEQHIRGPYRAAEVRRDELTVGVGFDWSVLATRDQTGRWVVSGWDREPFERVVFIPPWEEAVADMVADLEAERSGGLQAGPAESPASDRPAAGPVIDRPRVHDQSQEPRGGADMKLPIGQLITDPLAGRDAVHVAIAPTTARQRLLPGQHVDRDGGTAGEPVGVVDPFLRDPVEAGQRFYLCLYPNTVTSLRHEWDHPAYPKATPAEVGQAIKEYLDDRRANS